jgi:hypothetical protein
LRLQASAYVQAACEPEATLAAFLLLMSLSISALVNVLHALSALLLGLSGMKE